jgi:Phage integrase family
MPYNELTAPQIFTTGFSQGRSTKQAESQLHADGNQAAALYAHIGYLRSTMETSTLPQLSAYLRKQLASPLVTANSHLQFLVLRVKADVDAEINGQRDGRWCLVDLVGKGGRVRTVAIPDWTQQAIALWLEAMPIKEGPVLGKVNKGRRFVGAGMSAPSIYAVVVEYAERLGVDFRPHDLRRTYGKLAHKGGAKIEQIQLSYGHASLTTSERYLGIEQDLEDAPCDHLGLTIT